MARQHSPDNQIRQAYAIAADNALRIKQVEGGWKLYRLIKDRWNNTRPIWLADIKTPAQLYTRVCAAIGTKRPAPRPRAHAQA